MYSNAPFPRTKVSMHVQYICEKWAQPQLRDLTDVGVRVDAAHLQMTEWSLWALSQSQSHHQPRRKQR